MDTTQDTPTPDVQIKAIYAEDDCTIAAYAVLVNGQQVDGFATREEAEAEVRGIRAERLAERLRTTAEFIAAHPEVTVHNVECDGSRVSIRDYTPTDVDDLMRIRRAIGGRWEKHERDDLLELRHLVADGVTVALIVWREQVCERVVVGTENVEVTDPDAPKVTVEREVVEWRCAPLLADAEPQAA